MVRDLLEPICLRLPSIDQPTQHQSLKDKIMWSGLVLLVYFALTNVAILGLAQGGTDVFGQFRSVLAGSQGSILQLGIGPIVTASIILQLLAGVDLLGLDLQDPRDQQFYQGLQKLLVVVMVFITGIPLAFSQSFLPASAQIGAALGIGTIGVKILMFVQIALGGIIILYLDEIVSNWGVGSGVGLFIIAGVSQTLIGGIFTQLIPSWYNLVFGTGPTGSLFSVEWIQSVFITQGRIMPILTTILIFVIVVYAESTKIEIPISNQNVKGARGRYPVKLIYASVMPLILVRAIQANIQLFGRMLNSQFGGALPDWFGVYVQGRATEGLMYYLSPIQAPEQWMWWLGQTTQGPFDITIRIIFDLVFMVGGCAVFALFWINTTNMAPRDVAEQLRGSGMQIPGFRSNTSVLENVLERYIPYVTVLGGALVGLLAVMANMLGTIGGVTGTGLLLAVSITYKLYEEIAKEKLMSLDPRIRSFFE